MTHRTPTLMLAAVALAAPLASSLARGDDRLAPFIDDATHTIVHIDVAAIDPVAWLDMFEPVVTAANAPVAGTDGLAEIRHSFEQTRRAARGMVDGYRAIGIHDLYVIGTFHGMSGAMEPPMFFVVPTDSNADVGAIHAQLQMAHGHATVKGDAVIAGPAPLVDLVLGQPPSARPDLLGALERGNDDSAVHLAIAPSAYARRIMTELFPELPASIGGGSSATLIQAMHSANGTAVSPPLTQIDLRIQSTDAQAAPALRLALISMIDALIDGPMRGHVRDRARFVELLTPQVDGDQLTLVLDREGVHNVLTELSPWIRDARDAGRQTMGMHQIRSQLMGLTVYAHENQGDYPEALHILVPDYITADLLINPRLPQMTPGYVYRKPPFNSNAKEFDAAYIMIHEAYLTWPPRGIACGFADGHVELIATEVDFKTRMAGD